ncbi:MAG TPA: toll/interleukin-1 receptor domain-containing protein [Fimbriimonadaceae bacterium]|nr:toll/interleukin-1 receptor domain-containing protein [Fimbriimonadaceae bacterium]
MLDYGGMAGNPRVFFSHSSRDQDLMKEIVTGAQIALNLKREDIRCTSLDGYDIPSGEDIVARLQEDGAESDCFVAVVTPDSIRSSWVLFELGARWGIQRHLVVVIAAGAAFGDIPPTIAQRKARRCTRDDLEILFQEIADLLNTKMDIGSGRRYFEAAEKLSEAKAQFRVSEQLSSWNYDAERTELTVVKFRKPFEMELVGRTIPFEVEVHPPTFGPDKLWIFHEVGGLAWPKTEVDVSGGYGSGTTVEGGTPPHGAMVLSAVLLNPQAAETVNAWMESGRASNHWPGLNSIKGAIRVGSVKVIVKT